MSLEKIIKTSGKVLLSQIEAEHSLRCAEVTKEAVGKAVAKLEEINGRLQKALGAAEKEMARQEKRVAALNQVVASRDAKEIEFKGMIQDQKRELEQCKERIGMYQRRVETAERNAYMGRKA